MSQSNTVAALVTALIKVQSKLKGVVCDAENPYFKSRYVTLNALWDALREPLSKNGLAVVQTTGIEGDRVYLETTLIHESGEFVQGKYLLNPVKNDPQAWGSALTYARRYALAAIVGATPDIDDDGNAATVPGIQATDKTARNAGNVPPVQASNGADKISDKQGARFYAIAKTNHRQDNEIKQYLKTTFGIARTSDISRNQYDEAVRWAESNDAIEPAEAEFK